MNETMQTDILILGAGIGGYAAFRELSKELKRHHLNKRILVIDRNNYFTFTPMLHEVASGSVEPYHCAIPLRELIHGTNHSVLKAEVIAVKPEEKLVKTSRGDIQYEFCIVAIGSGVQYYGIAGADKYCHSVRSMPEALRLHEDFIKLLDSHTTKKVTLTIVGGGYTGVEVAGQFSDLATKHLRKLYPEKEIEISIIQNAETLVPELPLKAQKIITSRLENMGVRLLLNSAVQEVRKNSVLLKSGEEICSDFIAWTAGIKNIADTFFHDSHTMHGCLAITPHLNLYAHSNVYAVGDIAYCADAEGKRMYPPLGEFAHKEGEYVAHDIMAHFFGMPNKPFNYRTRGTLMPIGDWFGVYIKGSFVASGRTVWWLRRMVYLAFMPGFWRRIKIAIDWLLHLVGIRHIINIEK